MYDQLGTSQDRLREVRKDANAYARAFGPRIEERREAKSFHHNTRQVGQWTKEELDYMEERRRPAFTWNVGSGYVRKATGLSQASATEPVPVPLGGEDRHAREVMEKLLRALRKELRHDEVDRYGDEHRHATGEWGLHLHAAEDPANPAETRVEAFPVDADELWWDLDSRLPNRTDAKVLFWPRWVSKGEWLRLYDESGVTIDGERRSARTVWEEFVNKMKRGGGVEGEPSSTAALPTGLHEALDDEPLDYRDLDVAHFWDAKRNKVRLFHVEYKRPVAKTWLVHLGTGVAEELPADLVDTVRTMQENGVQGFVDTEIRRTTVDEVYWFEFAADAVLFDGPSPEPYDGFSVVPLVFALDWLDGATYGLWRNYRDPQRALNRRESYFNEMVSHQAHPGTDVEKSAMADEHQFRKATAGDDLVRVFADGKLATGVKERTPQQLPAGALALIEKAEGLFDKIGVSGGAIETPAGAAEAAFTVQVRQEWTKLDLIMFFDNYKAYQEETARKEVQIMVRAFPDHQIAKMLDDPERYRVNRRVVELLGEPQSHPVTGEPVPTVVARVALTELRRRQYAIDFDTRSRNQALRLAAFQTYLQALTAGVPIDPELLYEAMAESAADAERLKEYGEQAGRAQAAQAKQAEAAQERIVQLTAQVEAAAVQLKAIQASEEKRHNLATELNDVLALLEKADENERRIFFEFVRDKARATATASRNGGGAAAALGL